MKALVIGCNGYIGKNLLFFLYKKGVNIQCCDLQEDSAIIEFNTFYQKINIKNIEDCKLLNFEVDVVYFFAGLTGTISSIINSSDFLDVNNNGLNNILKTIVSQKKYPKFIFPSTRLVYKGSELPLSEDDIKENKTIYALNKIFGEELIRIYANFYNLKYLIFRLSIPYGTITDTKFSYGTIGLLLSQAKSGSITLFGEGTQKRTFTHIEYILEILLEAGANSEIINNIYNLSGENFSLIEIANIISKYSNSNINFIPWPENELKIESGSTIFNSNKIDNAYNIIYNKNIKDWVKNYYLT